MLSLAALCRLKGWEFHYLAKAAGKQLTLKPEGNHAHALRMGMRLHEVHAAAYGKAVLAHREEAEADPEALFIPQGGADALARTGVRMLAEEIKVWMRTERLSQLIVATPSGTGTTAAYLAEGLPECRIVTTPLIGDPAYLCEQIGNLMKLPKNLEIITTRKRYRFGVPERELYTIFRELEAAGIVFDLLYAPVMWKALLEHAETLRGPVLYVHSGGVGGNVSMLQRYRHRYERAVGMEGRVRKRGR